jgi:thiol:disulfide interchange protein
VLITYVSRVAVTVTATLAFRKDVVIKNNIIYYFIFLALNRFGLFSLAFPSNFGYISIKVLWTIIWDFKVF